MIVAFACDHGGFPFRADILSHLKKLWHEVIDVWPQNIDPLDDFPDYAHRVSTTIESKKAEKGVLVCGTGIGMSIASNRHSHIRAVVAYSPEIARISRSHNDANVICFWARTMQLNEVISALDIFLTEVFLGQKYQRRNDKLDCLC